jgi:uncharacterized protein
MDAQRAVLALSAALLLATSGGAAAASSSCERPSTRVERLICASPQVRRLDAELGRMYDSIESETRGVDGESGEVIDPFGDEHRRWLSRARNRCTTETCLLRTYRSRIAYVRRHWASLL